MPSASIDISPDQDGGLLKEVIVEGSGETIPAGCTVLVHYTGTLADDGTEFDSSRDRGEPFEFNLSQGIVIKAWDIGVATMKKGERAILTCTPKYAYGKAGRAPNVPSYATLIFDIEVLEWKGEDLSPRRNGAIERFLITPGIGGITPKSGALVKAHLIGKYEDRVFEDRDVTFILGEGSEENVIVGVEKALEKFKREETSKLIIQPKYAFGAEGHAEYQIPPNATVEYIVTLNVFEKAKALWTMNFREQIEQARLFKEKGTAYFKMGKIPLAIKMYKNVITYMENQKEDLADDDKTLVLTANLNLALCYLKLKKYSKARSSASAAIGLDPKSVKGFFRRGQAFLAMGEPAEAHHDFVQVLEVEPMNQAAKMQQAVCKKTLKEQIDKEKKIYADMFDKFAKTDIQKEEDEKKKQPDVMSSLGEWGKEDRHREPSEFEKENPNILMLNGSEEFKDM